MSAMRIKKTETQEVVAASDGRLTVSVPIRLKRRGGRQVVILAEAGRRFLVATEPITASPGRTE